MDFDELVASHRELQAEFILLANRIGNHNGLLLCAVFGDDGTDLSTLDTDYKDDIPGAMNELVSRLEAIEARLDALEA